MKIKDTRAYRDAAAAHRRAAIQDAEWVTERVGLLLTRLKNGDPPGAGAQSGLAVAVSQLFMRIAALEALDEVEYITTDPEADQQPEGTQPLTVPVPRGTADAVARELLRDDRDMGEWTGTAVLALIRNLEQQ
jgi:hypothetical protein